jgi:hypothetical protein
MVNSDVARICADVMMLGVRERLERRASGITAVYRALPRSLAHVANARFLHASSTISSFAGMWSRDGGQPVVDATGSVPRTESNLFVRVGAGRDDDIKRAGDHDVSSSDGYDTERSFSTSEGSSDVDADENEWVCGCAMPREEMNQQLRTEWNRRLADNEAKKLSTSSSLSTAPTAALPALPVSHRVEVCGGDASSLLFIASPSRIEYSSSGGVSIVCLLPESLLDSAVVASSHQAVITWIASVLACPLYAPLKSLVLGAISGTSTRFDVEPQDDEIVRLWCLLDGCPLSGVFTPQVMCLHAAVRSWSGKGGRQSYMCRACS